MYDQESRRGCLKIGGPPTHQTTSWFPPKTKAESRYPPPHELAKSRYPPPHELVSLKNPSKKWVLTNARAGFPLKPKQKMGTHQPTSWFPSKTQAKTRYPPTHELVSLQNPSNKLALPKKIHEPHAPFVVLFFGLRTFGARDAGPGHAARRGGAGPVLGGGAGAQAEAERRLGLAGGVRGEFLSHGNPRSEKNGIMRWQKMPLRYKMPLDPTQDLDIRHVSFERQNTKFKAFFSANPVPIGV